MQLTHQRKSDKSFQVADLVIGGFFAQPFTNDSIALPSLFITPSIVDIKDDVSSSVPSCITAASLV